MHPDPPSAGMLCMPVRFAHYECKYANYSPTSTMMTGLVVPPLFKSLDPPLNGIILKVRKHFKKSVA